MNHVTSPSTDEHRVRQNTPQATSASGHASSHEAASLLDSRTLLNASTLSRGGSSPIRTATLRAMQQMHGNRAVQRFVQRSAALTSLTRGTHAAPAAVSVQRWTGPWEQAAGAAQAEDKPDVDSIAAEVYAQVQEMLRIQAERNEEPTF